MTDSKIDGVARVMECTKAYDAYRETAVRPGGGSLCRIIRPGPAARR